MNSHNNLISQLSLNVYLNPKVLAVLQFGFNSKDL